MTFYSDPESVAENFGIFYKLWVNENFTQKKIYIPLFVLRYPASIHPESLNWLLTLSKPKEIFVKILIRTRVRGFPLKRRLLGGYSDWLYRLDENACLHGKAAINFGP